MILYRKETAYTLFFHMWVMKANMKSDCYTEGWLRLFLPIPEKYFEIYFVFTFLKRNVCLWIRNTICWKAQGFTRTKYHLKLCRESWNTRNFIRSWYRSVLLPISVYMSGWCELFSSLVYSVCTAPQGCNVLAVVTGRQQGSTHWGHASGQLKIQLRLK